MKLIAILLAMGVKWSILGVPLWGVVAILAPTALVLVVWYLRLKRNAPAEDVPEHSDDLPGDGQPN